MEKIMPTKSIKPNLITIYLAETKSELIKLLRTPGFTLPTFIFPLMFYLFFGVVFKTSVDVPTYLLATYGTFGIIGPALFSFGVGVAIERGQGWFNVKEVSPMPISAYIFARMIANLFFASCIIIAFFIFAVLFGAVQMPGASWTLLASILLFGTIPFCAMGLSLGLLLSSESAPAVVNLIYLPMALLSGIWIPINFFPNVLQDFANVLPAYHLSQLALNVVGMSQGQNIFIHIGVLIAYTLFFIWLSVKAFNRKDKK